MNSALRFLRNQSGNAMLIMMMMLSAGAVSLVALTTLSDSALNVSQAHLNRQKSLRATESARTVIIQAIQEYLTTHSTPVKEEVEAIIETQLEFFDSWGFEADKINVNFITNPTPAAIPNGTFVGMIAPQTTVSFSFDIKSKKTGENFTLTHLETTSVVSQISMFQFMYFMDLSFADWNPGRPMTVTGRVHVNGDFCAAAADNIQFENVTASGRVMNGWDPRCFARSLGENVFILDSAGVPRQLRANYSHGCTNCNSTGTAWPTFSLNRWGGNVKDSATGVKKLSLPLPGGAQAQIGADGNTIWQGRSNTQTSRFIVDPVRDADSPEIKKLKFASKAQLRIISGVWYIKDPANPDAWPGLPIWSDHPGKYSTTDFGGIDVGQDQIRALWAAKGRAWPAGDIPHAFSFYEYDKTNRTLYNDTAGVISYGTLARKVVGGIAAWDPGHKIGPADANHIPPPPSSTLYNMGHRILRSELCKSGTITSVGTLSAFSPITCTGSGPSGYATALLNGTRTGIADPHIALNVIGPVGYNSSQSAILPMNFDVGAFQTALLNTSAGELGSYFGFSGFLGEPFNGIVYITSRWPGSEDGYSPEGIAKGWPLNGSLTSWFVHNRDPNQIYLSHDSQHRALPFPLCSDTQTDGTTGAGDPFDNDGGTQRFRIAPCTSYGEDPDTVLAAYPSAIRLVNGRNFDQAALGTQGLSIVSNLPVYIQGSYNSNSNPASTVESEWTPSLVAGDMITVLSDAWDDAESNWRVAASLGPRVAVSSTYNTALLLGWARQSRNASRGVPASGIPVMMENWAGQPLHFTGAIAVGYYPVYYRQNPVYNFANPMSFTYSAGERYISYDPHFNTPARQPPGTPMFYISSVLNWKVD